VRNVLLPLLFLQAVAAFGQPVISAEVSSDLLRRQSTLLSFNTPAVAMAKDQRGVVIAWVMSGVEGYDRISVARLDATGHIAGSVHEIPVVAPYPVAATAPSIAAATTGQGFTIVWMELPVSGIQSPIAVYRRLDADLNPSASTVVPVFNNVAKSPAIVRSGKTMWITAGSQVWQVLADGTLSGPFDAGFAGSDMTVATDFPQIVSAQRVVTTTCGATLAQTEGASQSNVSPTLRPCPPVNHFSYRLQFLSLYTLSASTAFPFDSSTAAAVGNDGHDVLIAWFQGAESSGGTVMAARVNTSTFNFPKAVQEPLVLGSFPGDFGQTRPDIASDGERFVVVWRTLSPERTYDIVGASIDRNGHVIPFSMATTTSDEKDPSVIAIGPGKFLVAYEKIESVIDRRIAGRFVTFDERSHAVR